MPDLPSRRSVARSGISLAAVVSPLPNGGTSLPRRTLTTADVDALGIPDHDGGLQGIVLAGPDGKTYTLVVRPLLPDEAA